MNTDRLRSFLHGNDFYIALRWMEEELRQKPYCYLDVKMHDEHYSLPLTKDEYDKQINNPDDTWHYPMYIPTDAGYVFRVPASYNDELSDKAMADWRRRFARYKTLFRLAHRLYPKFVWSMTFEDLA